MWMTAATAIATAPPAPVTASLVISRRPATMSPKLFSKSVCPLRRHHHQHHLNNPHQPHHQQHQHPCQHAKAATSSSDPLRRDQQPATCWPPITVIISRTRSICCNICAAHRRRRPSALLRQHCPPVVPHPSCSII